MNSLYDKRKGDDAAYIQLFQQYEQELYAMAYVYAKNKEDALDIVQECAYFCCFIVYLLKPLSQKTDSMREYHKMERFCTVVVVGSFIAFSFGMNVTDDSQLLIIVEASLFYIAALITVIRFLRFMLRTGLLFLKAESIT